MLVISVNIPLVAFIRLQCLDIVNGLLTGLAAFLRNHADQCLVHIRCHALSFAADIKISAFLQPGIEFPAIFQHPVLHVDFFIGIAGKCHIKARQQSIFAVLQPFALVQKVSVEVPVADPIVPRIFLGTGVSRW